MADGKKVGDVTHYYNKIGVGIIKLNRALKAGDTVRFEGYTSNFEQTIDEIQYDHKSIEAGKKGQEVGVKVNEPVRDGDEVYLVE